MATLWLRVAEDTNLPEALTPEQRDRLSAMFDATREDSAWLRALANIGAERGADMGEPWLKWRAGAAFINWSRVARAVSAGMIEPVPAGDKHFGYRSRFKFGGLFKLARIQWRLERFIGESLRPDAGGVDLESRLSLSLALGLAALAHTLRLPGHKPDELARWLADPASAPGSARGTVARLQAIQSKRAEFSAAWREAFPDDKGAAAITEPAPGFFWEGEGAVGAPVSAPAAPGAAASAAVLGPGESLGLPVFAAQATGRLRIVELGDPAPAAPLADGEIRIFLKARPEAVECFSGAAGLIFCEGGVLAHACTVARERRIACVTAAGREFWELAKSIRGEATISIDGATGKIRLLSASR